MMRIEIAVRRGRGASDAYDPEQTAAHPRGDNPSRIVARDKLAAPAQNLVRKSEGANFQTVYQADDGSRTRDLRLGKRKRSVRFP
jgi:hypothetical protein